MRNRAFVLIAALFAAACGLLEPETGPTVSFEVLGPAHPPDSLEFEEPSDWYEYRPLLEVTGVDGKVVIIGDYTWSCANSVFTGDARFADGRLLVTIGHETPGQLCATATPKLQYRAEVKTVRAGPLSVTVRYDIWDSRSFGGLPEGIQIVLDDTVTVR